MKNLQVKILQREEKNRNIQGHLHSFDHRMTKGTSTIVPSESEVNAKLTELTTAHNAKDYRRQRAEEYPTLEAQLDDLYHNGIDGWKTSIKTIKDKYPKE